MIFHWWVISIILLVVGVALMFTAKWNGNVIIMPDGRFFVGAIVLFLDFGYTIAKLT